MSTEKLKAAYAAATPGPWEFDGDGLMGPESDDEQNFVCTFEEHPEFALTEQDYKNAEFIALAYNLMPQLLKAMELAEVISRMKTDGEIQERTDFGDCMSGADACETLSNLIESARALGE
jgi:hypothetical protein